MPWRWLVVLLVMAPTYARADYKFSVANNSLFVTSGKQRARVGEAISLRRVNVDKAARTVDVVVEALSCDETEAQTRHFTFAQLDARLENTTAFGLHRKHDYKAAAAGFARAVTADPTWNIAAFNLASAQQLAGDKKAAVATLRPWLEKDPIATYIKVTIDPELSPLLPELAAMRPKQAGSVTITESGALDGLVAYAPERKLLAVIRNEMGWGACVFTAQLEIYEPTGKLVATTPVIDWSETSPECDSKHRGTLPAARNAIADRAKRLSTMLGELGFAKVTVEKTRGAHLGVKATFPLPAHKLGVVATANVARVLRGNQELGHARVLDQVLDAAYIDDSKTVLVWSMRPGREGCEGSDPTQISIIAVP